MDAPHAVRAARFESLDGLRGVCALLVSLFHLNFLWHGYAAAFTRNSYLFVDFFFVLSGFVITHAYGRRIGSARTFAAFVVQRFGRLWPLQVFTLAVLLAIALAKVLAARLLNLDAGQDAFAGQMNPWALITNILLIHSLHVHSGLTWNSPSWSISVEFYTYLVFGAVLLLGFRLWRAAIVIVAAAFLLLVTWSTHGMDATYDFGMLRCLSGFFTGVLLYLATIGRGGFEAVRGGRRSDLAEVAAVGVGVGFVIAAGTTSLSFAAPFVFAMVIAAFARGRGILSRLLKTRPFQAIGRYSYSIYMVHFIVVLIAGMAAGVADRMLGTDFRVAGLDASGTPAQQIMFDNVWLTDLAAVAYVAVVVIASAWTYRFVELPGKAFFYRLARRWFAGRGAGDLGIGTQT